MYKNRFSHWGVWKNYRRGQYECYDGQVPDASAHDQKQAQSLMINSKPAKFHKFRRHRRRLQQQRHESVQAPPTPDSLAPTSADQHLKISYNSCSNGELSAESSNQQLEYVQTSRNAKRQPSQMPSITVAKVLANRSQAEHLFYVSRSYYEHLFDPAQGRERNTISGLTKGVTTFFTTLSTGLLQLRQGRCSAWISFDSACKTFKTLLQANRQELLFTLLLHFAPRRWQGYNQLRTSILRYMEQRARKCLVPGHPLTDILSICHRGDDSLLENACQIVPVLTNDVSRRVFDTEETLCIYFGRTPDRVIGDALVAFYRPNEFFQSIFRRRLDMIGNSSLPDDFGDSWRLLILSMENWGFVYGRGVANW